MEAVDLRGFHSGGYFLVRPGYVDSPGERLPSGKLVSLTTCICPRLSVFWGRSTHDDRQAALQFGISETRFDEFSEWCVSAGNARASQLVTNPASMFFSPGTARDFVTRFDIDTDGLRLVGAALPKELRNVWVEPETNPESVEQRIREAVPVDTSGEPLGYDVVSYEFSDFQHSWICSGLQDAMDRLYGIRMNDVGLLDKYADAKAVVDLIEEDIDGLRAEPKPYAVWLLLSYPWDG